MTKRLSWLPAAACLLACALPARAGDESLSRYAASYLLKPASARAMGMGNAFVAVANDTQAIYYNPAGLAFLRYSGFGSMFSPQDFGQRVWSTEYIQVLGEYGGLGAGIIMNEIGGIEGRADEFAAPTEIKSREGAALLSYGYAPSKTWALGLTAKYLFHQFSGLGDSGRGYAFDLGGKLVVEQVPGLTLGAAAQNLGGTFRWSGGRSDPLLFIFKTGAGYRITNWALAALDADVRGDKSVRLHAGAEFTKSFLVLRLGADHDHPTFGVGLIGPKTRLRIKFDYSYELDPNGVSDVSRFGFSARF